MRWSELLVLFLLIVLPVVGLMMKGLSVKPARVSARARVSKDGEPRPNIRMDKISFQTPDGIALAALYYPAPDSARGALLAHMMPAAKESWEPLAERLNVNGYHVLAIDLRGHGESAGGPEGYKNFSDEEHRKSRMDVEAGVEFLKSKGVRRVALAGASIGANLALQYAAGHADAQSVALLSAGINYYGVETLPAAVMLGKGKRVLIAASEDDMRKSGNNALVMARQLYEAIPEEVEKKMIAYHAAGHGTDMFGKEQPDLVSEIVSWLG